MPDVDPPAVAATSAAVAAPEAEPQSSVATPAAAAVAAIASTGAAIDSNAATTFGAAPEPSDAEASESQSQEAASTPMGTAADDDGIPGTADIAEGASSAGETDDDDELGDAETGVSDRAVDVEIDLNVDWD